MAAPSLDLACVSYLATADIPRVASYPPSNHGAKILERIRSTAGDGPIAALTASGLGLRAGLVANPVGKDSEGEALVRHLERWDVWLATAQSMAAQTPFLTIVDDGGSFRTWLAWMPPGAVDSLGRSDWSAMSHARLAYVDCYAIIGDAAVRAVEAAARHQVSMLLNLGGDPLTAPLAAAASEGCLLAVQTSVDTVDGEPDDVLLRAHETAEQLFDQLRPTASVVTIGKYGAVAWTADGPVRERGGGRTGAVRPRRRRGVHRRLRQRTAGRPRCEGRARPGLRGRNGALPGQDRSPPHRRTAAPMVAGA